LKHIHDSGFIHLDLKPANILITFEGALKIGDFGMATTWPAPRGIDGEGDREYIGPEILMGQYDKPADIFALGLIMLEIAGNVVLPDNGLSWQRLRSGDMSDVPSLTWSSDATNISRDSSGKPLIRSESFDELYGSEFGNADFRIQNCKREGKKQNLQFQLPRAGELVNPPSFMTDPNHDEALDKLVRWMISPQPSDRPVIGRILAAAGVRWAETRRRAGATIYEGNWGPTDEILQDDAEMIDV
jgi:mitosis inhibitor protein kinase SWE1